MSKWCPIINEKVIYQFCEDCEEQLCRKKEKEKKKELIIMSEHMAMQYVRQTKSPFAMISIVAKEEAALRFAKNDKMNLFRMFFNDIEHDIQVYDLLYEAPKQEDFDGLKDFIDNCREDKIVVHCAAGISRSAAVAQAISDYKNYGYDFWADGQHIPNRLVYRLAMNEFGFVRDQNYYNDFFAEINEKQDAEIYDSCFAEEEN